MTGGAGEKGSVTKVLRDLGEAVGGMGMCLVLHSA